jgi:NADH:ubiquinone oxidoreductase subunit 6 (subunit J)
MVEVNMSGEVALLLSAALLVTVIGALFSRSMSITLIMMFYASIVLGVIFTIYQGILVGLLHIIIFAGAVSVMLLTVVLMTGQTDLSIGKRSLAALLATITVLVVAAASYSLFSAAPTGVQSQQTMSILSFVWTLRPWDLLILVIIFSGSMTAVINLLSKEEEA